MAAETATLASFLASGEFITILLGFLLTLVVLYTLALFVKSIAKLRAPSEVRCEAVILCQNCAILHGRRDQQQQEQSSYKKKKESLANYEYPPKSPAGFQKCSACAARFKQKAGSEGGDTFYGNNQQHQIIFGKSKDSILVPDWFSSSNRNSSNDNNNNEQQHQTHENEQQIGSKHLECAGELKNASGAASVGVSTRVLTDEKGHSIKVRIASPPPQRQSQLIKQLQQQQQQSVQHSAAQRWIEGPRDSFASDCPLVSLPSLIWDENIGLEPDPEVPPPRPPRKSNAPARPPRSSSALGHNSNEGSQGSNQMGSNSKPGPMSPGNSRRRRHSAFSMAGERGGAAAAARVGRDSDGHDETSSEFEATAAEAPATNTTSGSPMEPFNDSNTSEFDDVPGCDSRQDTSVDYLGHLNGNGASADGQSGASPNSNEQVMDVDLRQMNRLNLQLALLQNAAQQTMRPGGALASGQLARHGSISSLGSHHHHHHNHLPQSGVLAPVGSQTLPTSGLKSPPQIGTGGQRAAAPRRQSSEDADSGCLQDAAEESRRSSGCLSSGERRLSSASTTPTWQHANPQPVASVRIRVRKLSAGGSGALAGTHLAETHDGKRSLLSSLANTIGRSRSTDSGAGLQDSQQDSLYEISLIEARNINKHAAQAALGANSELEARSSLRGRRDSLLGALMAAAGGSTQTLAGAQVIGGSPGAQRRSSVEGIFARVFKQQAECGRDSGASPAAGQSQTLGRHARLSPVSSCSSSATLEQTANSNESQIQLPLLKMSPAQTSQELVSFEQLAGSQGYKFTCRLSEFPVRLSLYQTSKRNSARLTLGHCILTPADWLAPNQHAEKQLPQQQEQQHFWPQVSKFVQKPTTFNAQTSGPPNQLGAFETIDEQDLPSGASSLEMEAESGSGSDPNGSNNERAPRGWTLDYRLHQTILEAIKAS